MSRQWVFVGSITLLMLGVGLVLNQCGQPSSTPRDPVIMDVRPHTNVLHNREAVIPPQCYTRAEGRHNPCYTCHQTYPGRERPNFMDDGRLQGVYDFSDVGLTNHWTNLFVDRKEEVAAISDEEILRYVHQDNYSSLIASLNATSNWKGPVPEIENLTQAGEAFDEHGFAKDGSDWVAFNYKPLPSTFWPTNGSTDDVMIRLPVAFRTSNCEENAGERSRDVYMANLAIAEAAIKDRSSITLPEIDERALCTDLNGDGERTTIGELQRPAHYVGDASDVPVTPMLYPVGTQFLHTVRYVGVNANGDIYNAPRMKEVRYMKKLRFYSKAMLRTQYGNEYSEKTEGNLPSFVDRGDEGVSNGFGWTVLGFIENEDGWLRQQTQEEHLFCMGCHTTIGSTIDQTFAFPRKVTGADGWGYLDLRGMADAPSLGETEGEILSYLKRAHGGNEFRENEEMQRRWFGAEGEVDVAKVKAAEDVYELITPSRERALTLNKAYRVLVEKQSFTRGRDATLEPARNVYDQVDPDVEPLRAEHRYSYDIRLDW